MIGRVFVAAAAAALVAGPVPAAAQARFNPKAPENNQLLPAFSYAAIEPVLAGIGARYQRSVALPGSPALLVTFANGRKAVIVMGMCTAGGAGCRALSIQAYWSRIAIVAPENVAGAIEAFNRRYSFAKAFIAEGGRPTLQRYLTADYGFIRGNLAVNLLVFSDQTDRFATEVLKPLEALTRKPAAPAAAPHAGGAT